MNLKTFNTKEFLLYGIPVMLVDLAIHIGIYKWLLSVFVFTDRADRILLSPRCVYFLVIGFIIAMVLVPSRPYERGFTIRKELSRVLLQCVLTLGVLAASVNLLFHSFAGHFYLYEGMLCVVLIGLWLCVHQSLICAYAFSKCALSTLYRSSSWF